jgi:hypothetical protein
MAADQARTDRIARRSRNVAISHRIARLSAERACRRYGLEHDEYARTSDGWKIKRVVITRVRIDPLEGGLPEIFQRAAEDAVRPLQ